MARTNGNKKSEPINPLGNITGIAYDMELQIIDAIGIARTAQETQMDDEGEPCDQALGLILYRLEQIQAGHALIAKLAPYETRPAQNDEGRSS